MDAAGDFIIAVQGYEGNYDGQGVYAQAYNASGTPTGSEFHVNTYVTNNQESPAVAMDSAGDFTVAWQSEYQDGSQNGVYAQRYTASGTPQGSEFLVNTYTLNQQALPAVAMDAAGDLIVTWQSFFEDGDGYGVYAKQYPVFNPPVITTTASALSYTAGSGAVDVDPGLSLSDLESSTITSATVTISSGYFSGQDVLGFTNTTNISGSFNAATGTLTLTGSDTVADYQAALASVTFEQSNVQVAVPSVTVSFSATDAVGITSSAATRVITLPQAGLETEFQVNTYTAGNQENPRVAADSAGDYVIVWSSEGQDGSSYGIYAQLYNRGGVAQGTEFQVNTFTSGGQNFPSVAMDSAGDFVIAWQSYDQDGSAYGIYAQAYNKSGAPAGSEFLVNTSTLDNQQYPSVAMDSTGDFVITWQSYDRAAGGLVYIYGQQYNFSGASQPVANSSEFMVNTYTSADQFNPSVAMDAAGDFVVAWPGYVYAGNTVLREVYAQAYNASGAAQGSEFQVNTTTVGGEAIGVSVAMDPAGDFVVAWSTYDYSNDTNNVDAQRLQLCRHGPGGAAREPVPGQFVRERKQRGVPLGGRGFSRRLRRRLDRQ